MRERVEITIEDTSYLFLALYFFLIVLPVVALVIASFLAGRQTFFGVIDLANWSYMYTVTGPVLVNTLLYSIGTAILTTILGIGIGWSIARTNIPFGGHYYYIAFIGLFFPPVAWEMVWLRLVGDRGVYATFLGRETLHAGTIPGMIFISSILFLPLALILLIPLFRNVDATLEEAARVSGSNILVATKNITIPLIAPGILAVFALSLLISLGAFRVPLLIGQPNGIDVLAITIWETSNVSPLNIGLAMTQAVLLVALCVPALFIYRKYLGKTEKYATISGSGYSTDKLDIGMWRYPLSGLLGLFFFLTILFPLLFMVYSSLLPFYIPPSQLDSVSVFSLEAYTEVLVDERVMRSLVNSIAIAFVATFLIVLGAIVQSWVVQKTRANHRWLIDYVSFSALGIPSIALAAALMYVYLVIIPGGSLIYGSIFILFIAFYTRYIPSTVKIIEPGVIQVSKDLFDAGKIAGDSLLTRLRNILVPLIKGSIIAAFSLRFAIIFIEMPIVMMLSTSSTEMVAVTLFMLQGQGQFTQVSAFGVIILAVLGSSTYLFHALGEKL